MRSASDGIVAAELAEIARLGNYRAASTSGPEPPGSRVHPVALRYALLQSGRRALIRSVYSGTDYSGRGGNFMAHTLVPDHGSLARLPTDYLDWPGWSDGLSPDQDTNDVPPQLPAIELDAAANAPAAGIALESRDLLADATSAAFFIKSTGRKIIFKTEVGEGPRWIAAVLQSLPLRHALELSVSTYQFDAIDCADVNATVEGTRFGFSQTQLDFEFFAFDTRSGARSKLPQRDAALVEAARIYGQRVADWYVNDEQALQDYRRFAGDFTQDALDVWLTAGLRLFENRRNARAVSREELSLFAEFIHRFTERSRWAGSITLLLGLLGDFADRPSVDNIEWVIKNVLAAKDSADGAELAELAVAAVRELLFAAVDGGGVSPAAVDTHWKTLVDALPGKIDVAALFDTQTAATLSESYAVMAADRFELITTFILRSEGGEAALERSAAIQALLAAAAARKDAVDAIVSALSPLRTPAAVTHAFEVLSRLDLPAQDRVDALARVLQTRGNAAWEIRRALFAAGAVDLLLNEFSSMSARSGSSFLATYSETAAHAAPELWKACRGQIIRMHWQGLAANERQAQASAWVAKGFSPDLPAELRDAAINEANVLVSLDPDHKASSQLAVRTAVEAAAAKIVLVPDRPKLREQLGRLRQARQPEDVVRIAQYIRRNGDGLTDREYQACVGRVLAATIVANAGVVARIVTELFDEHRSTSLAAALAGEAEKSLRKGKLRARLPQFIAGCVAAAAELPNQTQTRLFAPLASRLCGKRAGLAALEAVGRVHMEEWNDATDAALARLDALVAAERKAAGSALWRALGYFLGYAAGRKTPSPARREGGRRG
jgi:3-dehydroquinate dehydratase